MLPFQLFLHLCLRWNKDPPQTALHPLATIILKQPTKKNKTVAAFLSNPRLQGWTTFLTQIAFHQPDLSEPWDQALDTIGASRFAAPAEGLMQLGVQRMASFPLVTPGGDGRCLVIKPGWTMDGALLGVCLCCSTSPGACHSWLPFRLHLRKSFKMSRWIYLVDSYGLVPIWCNWCGFLSQPQTDLPSFFFNLLQGLGNLHGGRAW